MLLLQYTASLGAVGSATLAVDCHTAGGGGRWKSYNARAHQLGGRGVLPRRRSLPMERLRGTAAPIGAGPPRGGTGSPAQAVVGAYGLHAGDGSPQWPGPTKWGDGESCPGGARCLWSACGGWQPPKARAHQLGGRGVPPRRRSAGLVPYLKGYLIPLPGCPTGRVPTGGHSCTSPYS